VDILFLPAAGFFTSDAGMATTFDWYSQCCYGINTNLTSYVKNHHSGASRNPQLVEDAGGSGYFLLPA